MDLVKLEVERYDWAAIECACRRPAGHLADALVAMARGRADPELVDHVMAPGGILVGTSLPALAVSLAAITTGVTGPARAEFFHLVLCLIGDNGHGAGLFEGRDPVVECRELARTGLWMFYAEVLAGQSGSAPAAAHAFDIVRILEEDGDSRDQVLRVQAAAAERLPWGPPSAA